MSSIEHLRSGYLYEARFAAMCLENDLDPHPCPGGYLRHDYVVTNSAGNCFRVQVKGTNFQNHNGKKPRYTVHASWGRGKNPLDCSKVDVFAAHVKKLNIWYLIPCLRLTGRAIHLYPDRENSAGRYEKFKENWDCFKV